MSILSLDIGGTKIVGGIIDNGKLRKIVSQKTKARASKLQINQQILGIIGELIDKKVKAICIAVPGIVGNQQGIVNRAPNISNWQKVPLRKVIQAKYKVPVLLINDANAFVLGEKYFGHGKHIENLVGITLGTGMGTGIIINNQLYTGYQSGAGEFGRMIFRDGLLEHYTSGQFFKREYKISGDELFKRAKVGNKQALKAFHKFGENLGQGLSIVIRAVNPEMIILGGSISKGFKFFQDSMFKSLKKLFASRGFNKTKIKKSNLKNITLLGCSIIYNKTRFPRSLLRGASVVRCTYYGYLKKQSP